MRATVFALTESEKDRRIPMPGKAAILTCVDRQGYREISGPGACAGEP